MSTFDSINPTRPTEVLETFELSDEHAVDVAVGKASAAQVKWSQVPIPARADVILRAAEILETRKPEFATLVAREVGKILVEAGGDVQEAIDMARFVAGQGRAAMGNVVPSELPNKMAYTTRQPVGVVGCIAPWNFPIAIPSWKLFPALLAGNGVVLKPSEFAPKCATEFVKVLVEAGIPQDLVQVVHGFAEPAAALVVHPNVGAVSFTGSVPTGRKVAAVAMETGPRLVSLELGGKNAMIVMPDADVDLVVDGALFGAFGTSGQRCTSTSRLVVHRAIAKTVLDVLIPRVEALKLGDPLDASVDVGPVITLESAERIDGMVNQARAEGAQVVTGGEQTTVDGCDGGAFYLPTVLTGVQPSFRIAREEVFGPVLTVIEVDSLDEAVNVVNDVEYGLSACIYTRDINSALHTVDQINTGIVYVNAPTIGAEIPLPFGGTKHTGNGFREAGTRGIEQFSEIKTVYIDYSGKLQKAQIDNRPS